MLLPVPLNAPRKVVPRLRKHQYAPLATDPDADLAGLAADLDLDPAILVAAVGPPFLLRAGVAKKPSHGFPPVIGEHMERRLAGGRSSSLVLEGGLSVG
jgi:hypothetical protein